MNINVELKPCHFCKSKEPKLVMYIKPDQKDSFIAAGFKQIRCEGCGACGPISSHDLGAITYWNEGVQ